MQNEIWKPVVGYEGLYEVSNLGGIRRISGKRKKYPIIIKPWGNRYELVRLSKNSKLQTFLVHRIVAENFIPNPNRLPYVNHIDANPFNNRIENLEWVTPLENITHSMEMNRWVKPPLQKGHLSVRAKLKKQDVLNIRASKETSQKLALQYSVSRTCIDSARKGLTYVDL